MGGQQPHTDTTLYGSLSEGVIYNWPKLGLGCVEGGRDIVHHCHAEKHLRCPNHMKNGFQVLVTASRTEGRRRTTLRYYSLNISIQPAVYLFVLSALVAYYCLRQQNLLPNKSVRLWSYSAPHVSLTTVGRLSYPPDWRLFGGNLVKTVSVHVSTNVFQN